MLPAKVKESLARQAMILIVDFTTTTVDTRCGGTIM